MNWLQRAFKPHPFRLLLALEWILIGLSLLSVVGTPGWFQYIEFGMPLIEVGAIVSFSVTLLLFWLLGLYLPQNRTAKVLYFCTCLGLVGFVAQQSLASTAPLLLVLLLRCCLIFKDKGRWIAAGMIALVYPLSTVPVYMLFWLVLHPAWLDDVVVEELPPGVDMVITAEDGMALNVEPEQLEQGLGIGQQMILRALVEDTLLFVLITLFVMLLVNALMRERQGRRQLVNAYEQLYQQAQQVDNQATLQERTRIAREIHDSLGHLLTTQNILLQTAEQSWQQDPETSRKDLARSRRISVDALAELRRSVRLLRQPEDTVLAGRSLSVALKELKHRFSQTSSTFLELHMDNVPEILPLPVQLAVYRIVEEALNNLQKHSNATQATVQLRRTQLDSRPPNKTTPNRTSVELRLKIEDNGSGFLIGEPIMGYGIRGMKERAERLGGTFRLHSSPNEGCRIQVTLPLQ